MAVDVLAFLTVYNNLMLEDVVATIVWYYGKSGFNLDLCTKNQFRLRVYGLIDASKLFSCWTINVSYCRTTIWNVRDGV
jgi:hypothetical protein